MALNLWMIKIIKIWKIENYNLILYCDEYKMSSKCIEKKLQSAFALEKIYVYIDEIFYYKLKIYVKVVYIEIVIDPILTVGVSEWRLGSGGCWWFPPTGKKEPHAGSATLFVLLCLN